MTFSVDIARFLDKAEGNIDAFVQEFSQDIAEEVVTLSPVDTGFFRSNWRAQRGRPSTDSESRPPEGFATSSSAAAQQSLSKITTALSGARGGDIVYINNNAAYAQKLEFGSSKQAPNGMVRITLAKAPQIADAVARRINR